MDTHRLLKNRYRLGRVIGRGGMGVVWLATDEVLDRHVAVKEVTFPPGLPDDEQDRLRRRTMREARTNARLNHPNVVGLYDIVEDEDRPWIVMEYVPSRSLAEVVRADGPLPPWRAAEIGLQLLGGLRAAHAAGVLHRDVKPSNVLLGEDGRVVLGDFGIATAEGGSTVTSSGVLIGSPSYMAPERARGGDVGPESDLWSLGATLYSAVEGRPPFDRDSAVATLAALVMDDPDEPERAGPLWPVIRSLLRRDPARRPDAEEVAERLREIAAEGARPAPPERPPRGQDAGSALPGGALEADADAPVVPRPRPAPDASPKPLQAAEPAALPVPGETGSRTAGEPTAAPTGAATGTVRTTTSGDGRRRALIALTAVVPVLVVALLGWAASGLFRDTHSGHRSARHPATTPGRSAATSTPPAGPSGGRPSSPAGPPSASATAVTLPSGYHWHHDGTGFSIAVPNGWSAGHHGHYLYVEDPKSSRLLIVDQSDTPKSDPLADWREQESARRSTYSGYHRIRLESVHYAPARKAADWEFTYDGSHGRTHVLNRNILANGKHAYALYWSVPDSRWKDSLSIFDAFAATFRPAEN